MSGIIKDFTMNELVKRLSISKHVVVFESQIKEIHDIQIRLMKLKFVHIKFINTKGGTELGINIEDNLSCFKNADLNIGKGTIHIVGWCVLNYHKVRCIADIDLSTKEGLGYLEVLNN